MLDTLTLTNYKSGDPPPPREADNKYSGACCKSFSFCSNPLKAEPALPAELLLTDPHDSKKKKIRGGLSYQIMQIPQPIQYLYLWGLFHYSS